MKKQDITLQYEDGHSTHPIVLVVKEAYALGKLSIHRDVPRRKTWTLSYDGLQVVRVDGTEAFAKKFLRSMVSAFAIVEGKDSNWLHDNKNRAALKRLQKSVEKKFDELGYVRMGRSLVPAEVKK